MRRLRVLLAVLLIVGCTPARSEPQPNATAGATIPVAGVSCAASAAPPGTERPSLRTVTSVHVVVLGDSLAAGDDGLTATEDRWWFRATAAINTAQPDRTVVVSNLALRGSGIDYLEQTSASLVTGDHQVAVVVEGRNDALSEAEWSPRFIKVIQGLERLGLIVILGTSPPTLSKGQFVLFSKNACVRSVAGTTRPLLDFEARWVAAGPAVAGTWYSDAVHASVSGQLIEAEMATTLMLALMK